MSCRKILAGFLVGACLAAQDTSPELLFDQAKRAEKQGKVVEAYLLYSEAAAQAPKNKLFWGKAQALRTRAMLAAKTVPAEVTAEPESANTQDGDAGTPDGADNSPPTPKELYEARQPQPPAELKASTETRSFQLRSDTKALWEQVTRAYGLDVVFDGDYQATPNVPFVVNDLNYRDALYALQLATGSFVVPISEKLMLVVKDTAAKRAEVETHISVAIPIPDPVSIQEAQELARSIQQVMEITRFGIDSAHRVVLLRDRISKVRPALELFQQMLSQRPEVAVEVDLYSVSKTTSLGFGFELPSSTSLVNFGKMKLFGTLPAAIPNGLANFLTFGGGASLIGIGVVTSELLANYTKSTSTSLFHSEVRSVDGQPAQLHVGDKFPILTATYGYSTQNASLGIGFAPTFNFEDLGLVLKITPKVHGMDEVSLEVEAEYKVIGGDGVNGIPIISNRKFNNRVRLRFDQAAIVAGLVNSEKSTTRSGLAGAAVIPIVGPLFSRNTKNTIDSETVLVLKPRLLSFPSTEIATHPIWVGPDSKLRIPL